MRTGEERTERMSGMEAVIPVQEVVKKENELKKKYLRSYGDAIRAEKAIEDEIQQLRLDKMCPSVIMDDMPHSQNQTDLSTYAAKIDVLMFDLKCKLEDKIELRREINRKIESMNCESEKMLIWLRYIKGMKWEEIAVKMDYDYRYVLKIHGRALEHFPLN